jgi:hypothetical protein
MSRVAGTGLVGLGVVLGVVGAILKYAVSVDTSGFNINTIGVILLIAGILVFVIGVIALAMGSRSHSVVREDVQTTPTGSARVEERRDDLI